MIRVAMDWPVRGFGLFHLAVAFFGVMFATSTRSQGEESEIVSVRCGFETFPSGEFTHLEAEGIRLDAAPGNAEIDAAHARDGAQCLHLFGGEQRSVVVSVPSSSEHDLWVRFWAERWTRREPFELEIDARVDGAWTPVDLGELDVKIGGFLTPVEFAIPGGARAGFRVRCTSPEGSGLLIDDLNIEVDDPHGVSAVGHQAPRHPVLVGELDPSIHHVEIRSGGDRARRRLREVHVSMEGTTCLGGVSLVELRRRGTGDGFELFGEPRAGFHEVVFRGDMPLASRVETLDVAIRLEPSPLVTRSRGPWLHEKIRARITRLLFEDGEVVEPSFPGDTRSLRVGRALRVAGQGGVHTSRIPGLATTLSGALIAVYDLRHEGSGDLPGHIDVGMQRRGASPFAPWSPTRTILDMGEPHGGNGVGDPSILVDRKTGHVFVAALWSQGNRAWHGSGPGLEPSETGQWVMTRSTDEGSSWSPPINITKQLKDPSWRLLLQGPGKGISMGDGTLVFPAQFKDANNLPHSTIVYSKDHGETWSIGTGARPDTTEAQVVELSDGSLMLNMRDNRGGFRAVCTTSDLGATWTEHPSSRKALIDPVCMGSLISFPARKPGQPDILLFSNPHVSKAPRRNITIQASFDEGMTWPDGSKLLLHAPSCYGYSCMTRIDDNTVGILYEGGNGAHMIFESIPIQEILGE